MTKTFTCIDDNIAKQFDGVKLGASSSHTPGKTRWSEITLYRTVSGQYVAHGVGRSTIPGETDRSWVNVAVDADGLIAILTREVEGVKFIPNINKRVLVLASLVDKDIDAAYNLQYID